MASVPRKGGGVCCDLAGAGCSHSGGRRRTGSQQHRSLGGGPIGSPGGQDRPPTAKSPGHYREEELVQYTEKGKREKPATPPTLFPPAAGRARTGGGFTGWPGSSDKCTILRGQSPASQSPISKLRAPAPAPQNPLFQDPGPRPPHPPTCQARSGVLAQLQGAELALRSPAQVKGTQGFLPQP